MIWSKLREKNSKSILIKTIQKIAFLRKALIILYNYSTEIRFLRNQELRYQKYLK